MAHDHRRNRERDGAAQQQGQSAAQSPEQQAGKKKKQITATLPVSDLQGTGMLDTSVYSWQHNGGYHMEVTAADQAVPLSASNDTGYVRPKDRDWSQDPFNEAGQPAPQTRGQRTPFVNALHDGNGAFLQDGTPVIVPRPDWQYGGDAQQDMHGRFQPQPDDATGAQAAATGAQNAQPTGAKNTAGTGAQPAQSDTGAAPVKQTTTGSIQRVGRNGKLPFAGRPGSFLALRVVMIVLVLLLVGGIMFSAVLRVRRVDVEGNLTFTAEQIKQQAGVHEGMNILSIRNKEDQVRDAIQKNPYLAFVNVVTTSPWDVKLAVRERTEAAYLNYCGIGYVIDSHGVVLREMDRDEAVTGLIRVEGLEVKGAVYGKRVSTYSLEKLELYRMIMRELKAMKLLDRVTEIYLNDLDNLYLGTKEGHSIRLGRNYDIHAKLRATFLTVDKVEELQSEGKIAPSSGTIDVSAPETPGYIPENASRAGVAYITLNDNCYSLDNRGIVMTMTANSGYMAGLIRVDGLSVLEDLDGNPLITLNNRVEATYSQQLDIYSVMAQCLEYNGYDGGIAAINLSDANDLTMTTRNGFVFRLGNTQDLELKILNSMQTLTYIRERQAEGSMPDGPLEVDMRDPSNPVPIYRNDEF